ncbi:MAG: DEAD/DEAH box helicase [Bacteroidota bacterium]|nr:DEAD/DEAH box helicase [Bacteroidota bacterium]
MSQEQALYFYRELEEIISNSDYSTATQLLLLKNCLSDIVEALTASEFQVFSNMYSRLLFVASRYGIPPEIMHELHIMRHLAEQARRTRSRLSSTACISAARALARLLFFCSSQQVPESLRSRLLQAPSFTRNVSSTRTEYIRCVRLTVTAHAESGHDIEGETEEGTIMRLRLNAPWDSLQKMIRCEFCTLHATDIQLLSASSMTYQTTSTSMVILEPDYLVNVTELARCVNNTQDKTPYPALLNKLLPKHTNQSLATGKIVNYLFDALIENPDGDFDALFHAAVLQNSLSIIALQAENTNVVEELREQCKECFDNIRSVLPRLQWDIASIEPSFISPLYGLQGRLDLMIEYTGNDTATPSQRKTIVELKNSKPPAIATDVRNDHAEQVTGYNLLLDSCFPERSGDSCILYARTTVNPLRNVANNYNSKQQLLMLRNHIIAQEHQLMNRDSTFFKTITNSASHYGNFQQKDVQRFAEVWHRASSLARKYFRVFTSFVAREHWAACVGGSSESEGFARLWRKPLDEKLAEYTALAYLKLSLEDSDIERMHLHFYYTEHTPSVTTFRAGDIVILYPHRAHDNDTQMFLRSALLKGHIKSISHQHVVVSLRNKQLLSSSNQRSFLEHAEWWAIEPDFYSSEFNSQYTSLYEFLQAPEPKQKLLLGCQQPTCDESIRHRVEQTRFPDALTPQQHQCLAQALSTCDYFLLQGPPGTGKTSRMLKSMALFLYHEMHETVLFLAFTNRAVDEICDALVSANLDFLRLGSQESTKHTDRILYTLLAGKSINEAATIIKRRRIVVSTISSFLRNSEITRILHFDTVIVDEASQVVEPQLIGILSKFRRCILIGDEKQLPAVVLQPDSGVRVKNTEMHEISLYDLRTSLFERLLIQCKKNGWTHAYTTLSQQGRMHVDVAAFPNKEFYNSILTPLSERQTLPLNKLRIPIPSELAPLSDVLETHRVIFWNSPAEQHTKIHHVEAQRAALLAEFFWQEAGTSFHSQSIGIITPFRAQIANIIRCMPTDLRNCVSVDTVERYQGSERDVIILSYAVNFSSQISAIQSLSLDGTIDRKLNVALTRARERIIVLGRYDILSKSPIFAAFINFIRQNGGYVA